MNDRRALMAAIIANPDEDTPRLALADWLQEHGGKHDQARAEFIRHQIKMETLPPGKARDKVQAAADKLEEKHQKAWLGPLVPFDAHVATQVAAFRRGLLQFWFVDTSVFLLKKWQPLLPDALAAAGVEELCFYSPTTRVDVLAASPAVRWVARIQYPGADDAALAAFGRSPHFAHLSGLNLPDVLVTDKGLRAFAETANMPRLRELHLTPEGAMTKRKAKFSSAGVLALLTSGRFPLLTSLEIEGVPPAKFGVAEFFAEPALKQLTELTFDIHIPMATVLACPHLTSLRELRMHDTAMTDAEVDTLLASRTLANLKELSLALDEISNESERKLRKRFGDRLLLSSAEE